MKFLSGIVDELERFLSKQAYSSVFVLTDANTNKHCLPKVESVLKKFGAHVFNLSAGEITKNIDTCISIWEDLNRLGADRSSILINLGGGMITDLGGFVATTYKRGIDYLNIPTSMLAMVDASSGGKNGINLGALKNQVGTITSPTDVFIVPSFLNTLDRRNYLSGFAEAVKHGFLNDVNQLKRSYNFVEFRLGDEFTDFLKTNVSIKQIIVAMDPFEKAERKMLNFGHTIGHAVESLTANSANPLLHGEAVAWGMAAELFLSVSMYGFPQHLMTEYVDFLRHNFEAPLLQINDIQSLMELMRQDKKNRGGQIRFSLLRDVGTFVYDAVPDEKAIGDAVAFMLEAGL